VDGLKDSGAFTISSPISFGTRSAGEHFHPQVELLQFLRLIESTADGLEEDRGNRFFNEIEGAQFYGLMAVEIVACLIS